MFPFLIAVQLRVSLHMRISIARGLALLAFGSVLGLVGAVTAAGFAIEADADARLRLQVLSLALAGVSGILTAYGYAYARRKLILPMAEIGSYMVALADGDIQRKPPYQNEANELAEIGRALNIFHTVGITRVEQIAVKQKQKAQIEAEKARAETIRQQSEAERIAVVESLAGALERLAAGDLTVRLQAVPAEYEKLRSDFDLAVSSLEQTLATIVTSTSAVRSGANEVSNAANDLSRRTEQQAASIEETAAALDEITAAVRLTAEGADEVRTLVGEATMSAERSRHVVRDAIGAMERIEGSSRQIEQIIGVIDEIAFQTSLLALNAGVEAARAGDAGRGFAVVAQEVRGLAQRSAEAAKEIKALIAASSSEVGGGVDLVGRTGDALATILEQIGGINARVARIAATAREQANGLQEVNSAVAQMDQVTQQNAAMVEETTAAGRMLAQEAVSLASHVKRFSIEGRGLHPSPAHALTDRVAKAFG
ncbi:MAG TPA: methyl-accepting chemotaxis protein [Phenylobacterium sp.]